MSKLSTHNINKAIGQRLGVIRETSGLTQADFADKLGLSPRAFGNYERGEREMPMVLFRTLREKFGVDPLWTLEGPGERPVMVGERLINGELLEAIVRMVEEWLVKNRRTLKSEKKARLIRLAYEHCCEAGEVDSTQIQNMLSLAA